ncbi:MAG: OmpA family protein [Salinivirgaceae bacterium]|nr:OmpA family protein [Salinivirgaceae bacterium]
MRILTIGLLAFFAWSTLSTYVYVCKVKGLCDKSVSMQKSNMSTENAIVIGTIQKPIARQHVAVPKDLIIYFAFDKADFSSNIMTEKYFEESNAYLNQNAQAIVKITGHTDAIGTADYNQSLGYRRAQSLQLYFESKGTKSDKIIILSKGEDEPADNNSTKEGRANNRRTVITLKK